MIKAIDKLEIKGNDLNIVNNNMIVLKKKDTAHIILNGERQKSFLPQKLTKMNQRPTRK